MKKLQALVIGIMMLVGVAAVPAVPAYAGNDCGSPAECIKQGTTDVGGGSNQPKLEDGIKTIVNVMLFILGAIAVIMIIIGGIRYATSNGDASGTKAAKDTVLYAVIGLIVAILAYAIVNFVLDAFSG